MMVPAGCHTAGTRRCSPALGQPSQRTRQPGTVRAVRALRALRALRAIRAIRSAPAISVTHRETVLGAPGLPPGAGPSRPLPHPFFLSESGRDLRCGRCAETRQDREREGEPERLLHQILLAVPGGAGCGRLMRAHPLASQIARPCRRPLAYRLLLASGCAGCARHFSVARYAMTF
jgi:hypothetical protein